MKKRKHRKRQVEAERPVFNGAVFDFEIGTLVESPCRRCEMRSMLPHCRENCILLTEIQKILSDAIPSGHSVLPEETYSVMTEEG